MTPARAPTLYFFGVTTTKSSIMRVFPAWARELGLTDAVICGVDFPVHAPAADYRAAVEFLKHDPLSRGALVTTHKIDLYEAARDLFDDIGEHARLMGETSCIAKRGPRLVCQAKDPISSGLALDGFLPERHFERTSAQMLVLGAGGSAIAMTWHVMQRERGADRPSRVVVCDRDAGRLAEIQRIHAAIASGVAVDYRLVTGAGDNDATLAGLPPGSLVVNATGLGKDAPGSPLSNAARFPERGIVWDLNYRGELVFLDQAHAQQDARGLQIENGWSYFLHGWTQVIAEVFEISIPASGPKFDALSRIARDAAQA